MGTTTATTHHSSPTRAGFVVRVLLAAVLAALASLVATPPASADDDPFFTSVTARDRTFYPRVYDRYKDVTVLRWTHDDTDIYDGEYQVVDADGNEVMTGYVDYDSDSGRAVWDGARDYAGHVAPVGTYTWTITLTLDDGTTHTLTRQVNIATGTKWFKRRDTWNGSSYDAKNVRGNCSVYRARSYGEAWLNCFGGRYARVRYEFYLNYDRDIRDFRPIIRGERGCCAPGKVTKTVIRKRHDLSIRVQVNDSRAYDVWEVGFVYWAKDRI